MKNKTEVTLNSKGILVLVGLIAALLFALGFTSNNKAKAETNGLTAEDITMIQEIQQNLDPEMRQGMTFIKESDGSLVIKIESVTE